MPQPHKPPGERVPRRPAFAAWLDQGNDITQQFLSFGSSPGLIALSGGLPAPELYPVAEIEAAARSALANHGPAALGYGAVEGLRELREAIARRLSSGRLKVGIQNVLVTSGSLQGLELLGKVLIDPGDVILAENPTYLGALDAWLPRRPRYAKLVPGAPWPEAKFAYVVPNFANPTGAVLDSPSREALVATAVETGIWLIEDDPYAALRYEGATAPTLLETSVESGGSLDRSPVVHLGTLSKTIAPGLRIGWVVAAPEMIQALARAKQGADLGTSTFCQAVALELIRADADRRHAPALVAAYRERRDALCAAAEEHLSDAFAWSVPQGGMFVWMTARRPDLDTDALLAVALEHGVAFVPGSVFDPNGRPSPSLRLNFTANPPASLRDGIRRLARAVQAHAQRQSGPAPQAAAE